MQVYGIGLPRTGTMSLNRAFLLLGLAAHHCYDSLDVPPEVQAGTDTPFWYVYPQLAERYPEAKFVHVLRPAEKWIKSFSEKDLVKAHARMVRRAKRPKQRKPRHEVDQHCYLGFFGREPLTEELLRAKHAEHGAAVKACFADRPGRLLEIDLTDLDWPPLCEFLGLPVPAVPFPRSNESTW